MKLQASGVGGGGGGRGSDAWGRQFLLTPRYALVHQDFVRRSALVGGHCPGLGELGRLVATGQPAEAVLPHPISL